ncbi:hypothetical protein [Rhodococcus kronopolitis]|uniref:Uncharacterized protein n=1 Tax=Rhodococcus kronopolitis TaxID=1460226 RepID=A0ABV9FXU1_9NOCA
MSDTELRTAIRTLRERADEARSHDDAKTADTIEKTIHEYQEEMSTRL